MRSPLFLPLHIVRNISFIQCCFMNKTNPPQDFHKAIQMLHSICNRKPEQWLIVYAVRPSCFISNMMHHNIDCTEI